MCLFLACSYKGTLYEVLSFKEEVLLAFMLFDGPWILFSCSVPLELKIMKASIYNWGGGGEQGKSQLRERSQPLSKDFFFFNLKIS